MDPGREKRKEEINKALAFIQSSLAYPDPDGYQDFLTQLVCNLLDEGNAFFRDGQCEQAVKEFSEGLNVSCYAETEEIKIPEALLESLYVNRAAAYHSLGEYEQGVLDCNSALEVCKDSRRALYKKALCLKGLGKYKEAYDCSASYLLINPQDQQVNELAQELANHLGLKIRKPYVSAKMSGGNVENGNGVAPVNFPSVPQSSFPSTPTSCSTPTNSAVPERSGTIEDSELMGDDIDSLLDCVSTEPETAEDVFSVPSGTSTCTQRGPSVLPAPTPQLPPAFFSSAVNQLNSLDSFSGSGLGTSAATLDILDDLSTSEKGGVADASNLLLTPTKLDGLDGLDSLDSLDSLDDALDKMPRAAAAEEVIEAKTELDVGEKSLDELLDELDPLETLSNPSSQGDHVSKIRNRSMDRLDSLDSLDSFSSIEGVRVVSSAVLVGGSGLDSLSDFNSAGISGSHSIAAPVMRSPKNHYKAKENQRPGAVYNPLSSTHEFLQACFACYPREGVGIYTYVHKPDLVHNCKRDILLCRLKADPPLDWTRVRPLPILKAFGGRFLLCKELLKSGELGVCKYGEKCTFAYNQMEIDVWTEEKKGRLDRTRLFGTKAFKLDPVSSIICLLQENKGTFMFLCQACYDSKPRIISKRFQDDQTICSNLDVRHNFDANKCLAFVVRTHNVIYKKVRPLSILCHMDLCNQAIRYGCVREDNCHYAHSVIELKTWKVQRETGVSPDEIVRISAKYHDKQEQNSSKQKGNRVPFEGGGSKPGGGGGAGKSLNMRMKFACCQCWLDGLISEPDKGLKHCGAKARHAWTKDRRVLLVKSQERSKWVQVRPLPHAKDLPAQYYMCAQILEKRKCSYSGVCTFAHSPEEKDMWMYMKNNDLKDMQQMYDMWLELSGYNRQADGSTVNQPSPEEKYITMPTDYAEPMSGFHCRLCGKHSNSERQWQQHISTEKHKDRVFSCEGEDEALTWSYRFPGTRFELCSKLDGSCPDGACCDYAHSPEELQEWIERREFLRQKLAKAREDMLVMPDEVDFGKYNFLLQD
ncbi:zinc finger CCCH domain-containing protein 7B-like [Astatotilapia calliptera]|uniref:Zinc finger CCCH-type containing 7B n=1 Tax=Astatotilapia calliptera TaxID=8154 RepID=A0AAX7UL81_ASTCA|nr:zinc finger CCCH domain-containing protein 7B-like [Astatotilapia calliptera]XP_026021390.1 zinc finger CCCH domain-containing protein 7B-like [Astatotilapia calliptera]